MPTQVNKNVRFFFQNYYGYKYHWSENRVGVVLQACPHALYQVDPNSQKVLASYFYKDIRQLYHVQVNELYITSNEQ